jgi:peptidoglycan/xylan/chitin deacetylase (PgdA/CDA1 family)
LVSAVTTHALMYHDVFRADADASGFRRAGTGRYKLSWARFVDHLDRIAAAVPSPPQLADRLLPAGEGPPPWLLTFDDGGASAADIGDELGRRGWHGHFFITSGLIGSAGFLDEAAILDLHRMGHVVGSHSATHPDRMAALSFGELLDEWRTSVSVLSEIVGEATQVASIPGGYYGREVAVAAGRAGIRALFTSEPVRTAQPVGECLVIGRYSIRRDTTARDAANAAAGRTLPWLRQYGAWSLRKPIKAIAGDHYVRARRVLLALRRERHDG